jgi:hypothetical protein
MRQRQRQDQENTRPVSPPVQHPTTTEAKAAAEHFLAAADEAIERALSGDSEAFLAASRQTSAQ